MRRRDFITGIAGTAAWPLAARAQQAGKLPVIGLLGTTSAAASVPRLNVFLSRLRQLGWIEGKTVAIEYRWVEGRYERFAEVAAEFVRLKVDIIVTSATAPVLAAKNATSVIPIVFVVSGDPVGSGLVASLARPGGNVTGSSLQQAELASKRLQILGEIAPSVRRLAIMGDVRSSLIATEMREAQSTHSAAALKSVCWNLGRPTTFHWRLTRRSTTVWMRCTSALIRSRSQTDFALLAWQR